MNKRTDQLLEDFDFLYKELASELEAEINTSIFHKIEDLIDYYWQKKEVFFTEEEKLDIQQAIFQKVRLQLDAILHEKILLK